MTKPLTLDTLAGALMREAGGDDADQWCSPVPWYDAARAILTTIEQAGFRIVPVEADEGMIIRGIVERHGSGVPEAWSLATRNIWQAMLSASPKIEGTE